jgi:hypothetical protein
MNTTHGAGFEPVLAVGTTSSWLKDAIDRQPRLNEAPEPQPRPPGQHRWAAELATDPPRPA